MNNSNLENVIFDVKDGEKKWVTSIREAFSGCTKLKKLDFSNFDETKCLITKLDGAFAGCLSLTEIKGLENFDVSGATNFSQVFSGCISLEDFDISSWDMSSATDINQMLSNLNKLTELDLSSFEFNSIQYDDFCLTSGSNLERIYLPKSTNGKIITQQTSDDWYLYSDGVKGASVGNTIPVRYNEGDYIQKEALVTIDGIKYYPSDLARYDDDGDTGTPQVQAR
ncbi:MAG: DUF285 domain-containing protein [Clostridia bacterium]|nr:DUF285 domain-containing protein [Clostridia bacterium]